MRSKYLLLLPATCLAMAACHSTKKTTKKQTYMTAAYEDLKTVLNEADVKLLNDTVKVVFERKVLFDFGSATVRSVNYDAFQRFAQSLNGHSKTKILITGYTDSVGNEASNGTLSLRRADSAKNLLVHYKVSKKRIYTWGLAAKNPVKSNATEEGRKQNRRCEFILLYNYH